jgi:hypothetical protein
MGYQHYFTCIYGKKKPGPSSRVHESWMRSSMRSCWCLCSSPNVRLFSMNLVLAQNHPGPHSSLKYLHQSHYTTVFFTFGKGLTPVLSGSWFQKELLVPVFIYLLLFWFFFFNGTSGPILRPFLSISKALVLFMKKLQLTQFKIRSNSNYITYN